MREFVQKIHDRDVQAVKVYRQGQKDLIQTIQEMDRCHGCRDFKCNSLWLYCLGQLKLDESESSALIGIARKSYEVPELKKAVETGQIHISNARQIVPILNRENQSIWLDKAHQLSKRDLQKELAEQFSKLATVEKAKFVSAKRIQFQCGLDEDIYNEFLNSQNIVSSKKQNHANHETTLTELIRFYNKAHDPVLKAEQAQARKFEREKNKEQVLRKVQISGKLQSEPVAVKSSGNVVAHQAPAHVKSPRPRQYPAELKHQINLRDQRRCTHRDTAGKQCDSKRWLAFHHKIEVANGGIDTLDNLQTLCWAHHQLVHHKTTLSDQRREYQSVADVPKFAKGRKHREKTQLICQKMSVFNP